MSKTSRLIVIVIIILAVAAWVIYPRMDEIFGTESQGVGAGPAAARGPSTVPVSGIVVTPKRLENKIKVTGSILPNESLELKSEVSGLITKIHFNEGETVKKGTLLVSLKNDQLQAQLEKLKYSRQLAQETERRQKLLLNKEAISQEEYDISLTSLNTVEADIKVVEAQIAQTSIVAPFDGILGLREISEGAYITNSTVITNLYSIDPVKLDFAIPGKYAAEVKKGDIIYFQTESLSEQFEGEVYAIEPQIDQTTRTLRLRAICSNEDGKLLPGQFARIELVMSAIDDALMVPTVSVIPELNGHKVFIARGGKVSSKVVQIGMRTEDAVQIVEGISPQDTVITSGLLEIREGSSISISNLTR
ncbi:efflux RND transporter periplasmic adaptor subunit [Roseivirga sp.]|uniref:efflux RND transporter periplasmic adaptor subunit n=1 Tax=Roseivirga sp. TaxID=1964215 RepID=UPI003B52E01E